MQRQEIVIVGAGPSGVTAAVQCKRLGISPILLDAKGRPGGLAENAFSIENYPCIEPVDGPTFADGLSKHLERFGIVPQKTLVHNVAGVEGGWRLDSDQGSLDARAVIVACGTAPVPLGIPGADELLGRGLFYEVRQALAHLDAMTKWRTDPRTKKIPLACLSQREECLIIGGGEAALDYALTLASREIPAAIYVRGDRLKAKGRLVELVQQSAIIRLVFSHEPRGVRVTERGLAVEFHSPRGIVVEGASAVLVAIGRRPILAGLLKGLDVTPARTVSTRFSGLYIVGDARLGSLGQIGIAVGDGLAASMAACAWLEQ